MLAQLKKAAQQPERIVPHCLALLKRVQVKRVQHEGEWYYRYKGKLYPAFLHEGNAGSRIHETAKQYCHGDGIDVGANVWPFPGATPIDNSPEQNAHKLDRIADGSLDYVFSSHCLEHLDDWQGALRLWLQKLKPGGTLFLYLPHESMRLWNPGSPWVADLHRWQPTHEVVVPFLEREGLDVLDFNADKDEYWSFHVVARKAI
jgi:SAM-dependent methyltransferase